MKTFIFFTALLFLSLCQSCRKDKLPDVFSACKATGTDTSFQIQEKVGVADSVRFFSTDTIFASNDLTYFSAKDTTADEYSWQFGTDPRIYTGKTVSLSFDQPYGAIRVRLVQKRNPTNPCFGKLPSEVTYEKELFVVAPEKAPIIGKFYGHNLSDPTKKFTVTILLNGVTNIPSPLSQHYGFWNEVHYGSTSFFLAGRGTWDPDFGAFTTEGWGYLKNNNQVLQIDYSYSRSLETAIRVKDTFIGVRQ